MHKSKLPSYFYFLTLVLLYSIYQVAMSPDWFLGGEIWAEMATNYYQAPLTSGLLSKLFSTDYGYLPFPQRLICLIFSIIKIPTNILPFLYSWSSLLLIPSMVGVFCLFWFRAIIESDFSRFLFSFLLLLVVDFETKTFINFTYYGAFLIGITSALILVSDKNIKLKFIWFIPLLCISKPAVLAAIPGLIFSSKNKKITSALIFTISAGLMQLIFIFINSTLNHSVGIEDGGLFLKFLLSIKYFLVFIGRYSIGRLFSLSDYYHIAIGIVIFTTGLFICYKKRDNSYSLIIIGFLLIYFNLLINIFAIPTTWGSDLSHLKSLPVYRHNIISIFGLYLFVYGFFVAFSFNFKHIIKFNFLNIYAIAIFCLWTILTGWLSRSFEMNKQPSFPVLNSSYWKDLSPVLDNKNIQSPICIPLNPLGWVYSRGCSLLNPEINWTTGYYFDMSTIFSAEKMLLIKIPANVTNNNLISFAVVVRPFNYMQTYLTANAYIYIKGGRDVKIYSGSRNLKIDGGIILFGGSESIPLSSIEKIEVSFSTPVQVGYYDIKGSSEMGILWMGN